MPFLKSIQWDAIPGGFNSKPFQVGNSNTEKRDAVSLRRMRAKRIATSSLSPFAEKKHTHTLEFHSQLSLSRNSLTRALPTLEGKQPIINLCSRHICLLS